MVTNNFTVRSWDERVVSGGARDGAHDGAPRVAFVHATFGYRGRIEGTSTLDALLYYAAEGADGGTSPGLERFDGSVDGRTGTFVARHEYRFTVDSADGAHSVSSTFEVLPGSGTGELAGLTGRGTSSGTSRTMHYTFEPTFG